MKLNEALKILKNAVSYNEDGTVISGKSWILSTEGKEAIECVLLALSRLNDETTAYDFQGWVVEKKTMRDIIKVLKPTYYEESDKYVIDGKNPLLDVVPTILEDDGMGYGANSGKLNGVDIENNNINLWF